MKQARSYRPRLAAALLLGLLPSFSAQGEPLPKEACEAVVTEHAKLTADGLPDLVKKGPEWVRANQGAGRLQDVARYIHLHEEMLFRCGYDKLKALPGDDNDEASDNKTTADEPPPLPQRKPPTPDGFKQRPRPAAATAAATEAAPASTPAPAKRKRKPKADDAYRPPAKPATPQL
ncbi:MAG: hypothetical protein AB7E81_16425 [Hyphomicrobiaceae bacterium]